MSNGNGTVVATGCAALFLYLAFVIALISGVTWIVVNIVASAF